jgi:hypothetical protein
MRNWKVGITIFKKKTYIVEYGMLFATTNAA